MATRRCPCGLVLEAAGDVLACPACGPATAWRVQLEDGPVVAAASRAEITIAEEFERSLRSRPAAVEAAGPVHSFSAALEQLVRRARRGRL